MSAQPAESIHPLLEHRGPWTEHDYLALPELEGTRIELVDGDLVMSPWPDNPHQRLVFRLCQVLDQQVPPGYEALPGGNVRLDAGQILIPDVFITTIGDRLVNDVGDVLLVAEIVSKHGKARDRIIKPLLYAAAGVLWYLHVERWPELTLVLHRLENGSYVEWGRAQDGEQLEVPELGITIDVDALTRQV